MSDDRQTIDLGPATANVREYFRAQCVGPLVEFGVLAASAHPKGGYAIRCRVGCFLEDVKVYDVYVAPSGLVQAIKEIEGSI
jgi:hypothetical protein